MRQRSPPAPGLHPPQQRLQRRDPDDPRDQVEQRLHRPLPARRPVATGWRSARTHSAISARMHEHARRACASSASWRDPFLFGDDRRGAARPTDRWATRRPAAPTTRRRPATRAGERRRRGRNGRRPGPAGCRARSKPTSGVRMMSGATLGASAAGWRRPNGPATSAASASQARKRIGVGAVDDVGQGDAAAGRRRAARDERGGVGLAADRDVGGDDQRRGEAVAECGGTAMGWPAATAQAAQAGAEGGLSVIGRAPRQSRVVERAAAARRPRLRVGAAALQSLRAARWRDRRGRVPGYPLTHGTSGGDHVLRTRVRAGTAPLDDE